MTTSDSCPTRVLRRRALSRARASASNGTMLALNGFLPPVGHSDGAAPLFEIKRAYR